ncbi:hypothetical protein Tco_1454579, partial [Tanacetum coccineum]
MSLELFEVCNSRLMLTSINSVQRLIIEPGELRVVFAEENRKKPSDMRAREHSSECDDDRGLSYDRRGSSARYSRSPHRGRSYRNLSISHREQSTVKGHTQGVHI